MSSAQNRILYLQDSRTSMLTIGSVDGVKEYALFHEYRYGINNGTNSYVLYRWSIATYFKQTKGRLGFNQIQIRSAQAIHRYWILVQFAYLFLGYLYETPFTYAIHIVRTRKF